MASQLVLDIERWNLEVEYRAFKLVTAIERWDFRLNRASKDRLRSSRVGHQLQIFSGSEYYAGVGI